MRADTDKNKMFRYCYLYRPLFIAHVNIASEGFAPVCLTCSFLGVLLIFIRMKRNIFC